ncbi:MAG: hypothetical protein AB7U26_09755 [Sulfuricurvum sp.]|nr:hypothetical protein [Sulfuricurvum sp.]
MEQLVTVQKYAAMHRLSIHTVIKKTMNGELKSVEKEEDGKKTTYILLSSQPHAPVQVSESPAPSDPVDEEIDYKKAYEDLHTEYLILKTRYEKLLAASSHSGH